MAYPHGVVFDFDGVIANTEPLHLKAYQKVLSDTPLTLDEHSYYNHYLGYDDVGVFTALGRDQNQILDTDTVQRLIARKSRCFETLVCDADPAR